MINWKDMSDSEKTDGAETPIDSGQAGASDRGVADEGEETSRAGGSNSFASHHHAVRRKSSRKRHTRHNDYPYKKSPMERNRIIMKRETIKALMWILPTFLAVIGGVTWFVYEVNNRNGTMPKGLAEVGKLMTFIGAFFFAVALVVNWCFKFAEFYRDKRSAAHDPVNTAKRRKHKHHRRHSKDENGGSEKHGSHGGHKSDGDHGGKRHHRPRFGIDKIDEEPDEEATEESDYKGNEE